MPAAAWLLEQLLAAWRAIVDAWAAWRGGAEPDDYIEFELLPDDREMTEAETMEVVRRIMDPSTYNLEMN